MNPMGKDVVLCLSGGMDSMLLFSILNKLQKRNAVQFRCFHLNHQIRENAQQDEDFVSRQCYDQGIALYFDSVSVLRFAERTGYSVEQAGRELRHRSLKRITDQNSLILTAHHANDSVETTLLSMIRGSMNSAIKAMQMIRTLTIQNETRTFYRPLIVLNRTQIEQLVKKHKIPCIEDESNQSDDYKRNRIRKIVKELEKEGLNPARFWSVSHRHERNLSLKRKISDFAELDGYVYFDSFIAGRTSFELKETLDLFLNRLGLLPASASTINYIYESMSKNRMLRFENQSFLLERSKQRIWLIRKDSRLLKPPQIRRLSEEKFEIQYLNQNRIYTVQSKDYFYRPPMAGDRFVGERKPLKDTFQKYSIPATVRHCIPVEVKGGKDQKAHSVRRILLSFLRGYEDIRQSDSEKLD